MEEISPPGKRDPHSRAGEWGPAFKAVQTACRGHDTLVRLVRAPRMQRPHLSARDSVAKLEDPVERRLGHPLEAPQAGRRGHLTQARLSSDRPERQATT